MVSILMKSRHVFGRRFAMLGLAFLAGKWKLSPAGCGRAEHPRT